MKEWLMADMSLPRHGREEKRTILQNIREFVVVVLAAILISSLVKAFLFQAFVIPSASMENTLAIGDRIVVSKLYPRQYNLHRGDIVVFEDSQNWLRRSDTDAPGVIADFLINLGLRPDDGRTHLVKRIIGMPGDQVEGIPGVGVKVNGKLIPETEVIKPGTQPTDFSFRVTVPQGHLWVMGDNRSNSEDSRYHQDSPGGGFVPINDVTGKVVWRFWPINRIGFFPDYDVYQKADK